jgi:hypothetical protein
LDTNCIYHCPAREECSCMEVMEDNRCINDHFRAIVDQVCNCK